MKQIMEKSKLKSLRIVFILLSLASLVFVYDTGALLYNDSNAYFGMWPYVSAGYPFFLRGLHFIFGDHYAIAAVGVQFIVVLSSIYIFVFHFLKIFKLKTYQYIILLLLLFYPVFDSNIYMITNISTEGLCFALFLQVVYLSYLTFIKRKFKSTILLLFTTVILITIRGQFQFLIPIFLLIEILIGYTKKKFNFKYFIIILMIPLAVFLIDNVYHRVIQKQYFSTPFAWTAFVTSVLYLADDSDIQYLETENQKEVFKLVKSKFKEKGIGYQDHKYFEEPIDYNYFFYHYELPTLCNQTVQEEVLFYYLQGKERNVENVVAGYLKLEKTHKELFFKLLPSVFNKWIALAIQNFKTGIGGVSVVLLYLYSLIFLFVNYLKTKQEKVLFAIILLLCILVNRAVISVSVHGLTRYFFYTHWMSIFLLFIGINKFMDKTAID